MKISTEVSPAKLRGGFYSPDSLVKVCLDRVRRMLTGDSRIRVLEPSAGDGAFIAGLAQHSLASRVSWATSIEIVESEAAVCRSRLESAPFDGEVVHGSSLAWGAGEHQPYDVAVGNPPFVRFQFVDKSEAKHTDALAARVDMTFKGVSNLWLPVLVTALEALRPGGVFAFIVPAECFTGVSGHEVREWLLANATRINIDLFAPGSFPGVLQEVVVLSGRMVQKGRKPSRDLLLREHGHGKPREWKHESVGEHRTWTRFLLTPQQVASLATANELASVTRLSNVAKFEVATVTGANSFFTVDEKTLDQFDLWDWARPLLPRTRFADGLVYSIEDFETSELHDRPGYLLDFASDAPNPTKRKKPGEYLALGVEQKLPDRFKCRIRKPWYRVPVVNPGLMMMAKRSHLFPRVIVNDANVLTTDTIYRGRLLGVEMTAREFTASFHNSLTLLTAEIEGRSFGGGVLELVPSEISSLSVPLPDRIGDEFDRLDWVCRTADGELNEALVEATDSLVAKTTDGLDKGLMDELHEARRVLVDLRMARTG